MFGSRTPPAQKHETQYTTAHEQQPPHHRHNHNSITSAVAATTFIIFDWRLVVAPHAHIIRLTHILFMLFIFIILFVIVAIVIVAISDYCYFANIIFHFANHTNNNANIQ